MFTKVLIANRGEIAVRIIRACHDLGIATVAIYSDLDRDALHTRLATEAYALGGSTAAESYLNADMILDVLKRSGADALHPGYGFFAENADFARSVAEAGATFIGPSPESIAIMGDKLSARKAAEDVGVFGVPGNTDVDVSVESVELFASEHGWPVAIKAAYGGGGRGIKVVRPGDDIADAIESAAREAQNYFGRPELYIERFLDKPRHIEVQILADQHGNCVYLSTRDCSVQRRHQKLIEEGPAPDIDPDVLQAMGEAAVKVAQGCGYVNAGTIELLYEDGQFWYLEMNTRLQVEHPVTEMICGIDLVEAQLRIAAGEQLWFGQDDVVVDGHSIEIRINAEDPAEGAFLPSPGTITKLVAPAGFGTRFDTGYESGDTISQFYDNLIGKLIVWGSDRQTAIRRTLRALNELVIEGVATTIPAEIAALEHEDFANVVHWTKWLEDRLDLTGVVHEAVASDVVDELGTADLVRKDVPVEVDGRRYQVSVYTPDPLAAQTKRRRPGSSTSQSAGDGKISVPMQGTVVKVDVAIGDMVDVGDTIIVLEAMKMENQIKADVAGTVTEIKVSQGDTVGGGDIVAVVDPA